MAKIEITADIKPFIKSGATNKEIIETRAALNVHQLSDEAQETYLKALSVDERVRLEELLGNITEIIEAAISNDAFMNR